MSLPRAFSGVQPTGRLHLGNYLGAIRPWVQHQHARENVFCVVDLHALTVPEAIEPAKLRATCRGVVAAFLASGIDPAVSSIFIQSHVRQHSELCWVLNCVTPLGWLDRMTQFKSKSEGRETVGTGLLDYPVLMAADILLYDSNKVPVGKDQKQHLEVTRSLATKLNETYGEGTVVMPEAIIREETELVIGLDGRKMSKSYDNTLPIFGDEKKLRKIVMKIVTDSTPVEDPKPTENSTVIALYQLFASEADLAQMIADHEAGGIGYGDFKKRLADAYWDYFSPMRARRDELAADPGYVDEVLRKGAERAREEAAKTLERVRKAVGLI
jgi:tryptophanyl-tRNA synthetase